MGDFTDLDTTLCEWTTAVEPLCNGHRDSIVEPLCRD